MTCMYFNVTVNFLPKKLHVDICQIANCNSVFTLFFQEFYRIRIEQKFNRKCWQEQLGVRMWSFCLQPLDIVWAWEMSGGFHTYATAVEEVKLLYIPPKMLRFLQSKGKAPWATSFA